MFIPDSFFEGSLDDFWRKIPSLDADFEARRKVLEREGKRWRFVARFEGGKGVVERYNEYPMLIQGYGAGASVTAAGVFADIMSIANI